MANETDRLGTPAMGSASNLLLGGGGRDRRPDHLECHWHRSRSARILYRDAWFQMGTFVKGLFPPDLSVKFLRATLWSGVETMALSLMGTVLAVLIALPLGIVSSRTVLGGIHSDADRRLQPAPLVAALILGSTLGLNTCAPFQSSSGR